MRTEEGAERGRRRRSFCGRDPGSEGLGPVCAAGAAAGARGAARSRSGRRRGRPFRRERVLRRRRPSPARRPRGRPGEPTEGVPVLGGGRSEGGFRGAQLTVRANPGCPASRAARHGKKGRSAPETSPRHRVPGSGSYKTPSAAVLGGAGSGSTGRSLSGAAAPGGGGGGGLGPWDRGWRLGSQASAAALPTGAEDTRESPPGGPLAAEAAVTARVRSPRAGGRGPPRWGSRCCGRRSPRPEKRSGPRSRDEVEHFYRKQGISSNKSPRHAAPPARRLRAAGSGPPSARPLPLSRPPRARSGGRRPGGAGREAAAARGLLDPGPRPRSQRRGRRALCGKWMERQRDCVGALADNAKALRINIKKLIS